MRKIITFLILSISIQTFSQSNIDKKTLIEKTIDEIKYFQDKLDAHYEGLYDRYYNIREKSREEIQNIKYKIVDMNIIFTENEDIYQSYLNLFKFTKEICMPCEFSIVENKSKKDKRILKKAKKIDKNETKIKLISKNTIVSINNDENNIVVTKFISNSKKLKRLVNKMNKIGYSFEEISENYIINITESKDVVLQNKEINSLKEEKEILENKIKKYESTQITNAAIKDRELLNDQLEYYEDLLKNIDSKTYIDEFFFEWSIY